MKINRKGVTRIVFVFRHIVVKVPNPLCQWSHFLRGLIANMDEGKTWRWNSGKYDKGLSRLLCPVKWYSWGGWILIMKRAQEISDEEWVKMPYFNTDHMKHFRGDDTVSNYGIFEGRLVKIDYADLNDHWGEDFKKQDAA